MGEEGREELVLDVFQENSSTVEDAGGVREGELLDSKKLLSELVDEGGTKEQEEIGEQIHVQERIQVLLCPMYRSIDQLIINTNTMFAVMCFYKCQDIWMNIGDVKIYNLKEGHRYELDQSCQTRSLKML